jgi:hypothetical protein
VEGVDGDDGLDVIDLFFAEDAGLGELAAVSESVTYCADLVYACDNAELGIGEKLKHKGDSFVVGGHGVVCLIIFLAGALVCDSTGKSDLFAQTLSQNLAALHIEKLILERAASGIDYQNFHKLRPFLSLRSPSK